MRSVRSAFACTALIAVAIGSSFAACSSSGSKSASQQVCDARSDFSDAVSKVADDLRALNLGQARDDADAVRSTFDKLADSFKQLTQEQRDRLQPQIDKVKSDVSSFSDVRSVDEIRSSLDSTQSDVKVVVDAIQSDLKC